MIIWTTYPAEKHESLQALCSITEFLRRLHLLQTPLRQDLMDLGLRARAENPCEDLAGYFREDRMEDDSPPASVMRAREVIQGSSKYNKARNR